jgi:hypothetical protein
VEDGQVIADLGDNWFGWIFALLAVIYRGLESLGMHRMSSVPVTSRGTLLFSCFLFLACIATGIYERQGRL